MAIIIIASLVLAHAIGIIGCGSDEPSPEDTVRDYFHALETKDATKLASCFTDQTEDEMLRGMELYFRLVDSIRIYNISTTVVSVSEDWAEIDAEWDIEVTILDETENDHVQMTIDMVKEDGRWLISFAGSPPDVYEVDEEVMQLASATFYSDWHAGWRDVNDNDDPNNASTYQDNVWGDSDADVFPGHYYPTAIAVVGNHILKPNPLVTDPETGNPRIDGASGAATTAEITAHAVWMGLLVNISGEGTQANGSQDRDWVSPLKGETSLYLQLIPESAMPGDACNGGPEPGGGYCWVVGENGVIYGAYKVDNYWYAGFNGSYP